MMYDIIVFENIGFRPSTRKREAGVFKNLHSGKMRFRRPISPDTCGDLSPEMKNFFNLNYILLPKVTSP